VLRSPSILDPQPYHEPRRDGASARPGGHLVLYLAKLAGSRSFAVPLRATWPVKGKVPAGTAYAYCTPELQTLGGGGA
jgi:hypothetical protein